MKTLVLIRHAKSSWEEHVTDLERPLSSRGYADANLVANQFKNYNFQPQAVYSSPAARAFTTCLVFMETLGIPKDFVAVQEQLYDFGGNQVRRFIDTLDDHLQKVMIFGHNHAFTTLVNGLGNKYLDNLPTSGLVRIDFDIDHWKDLERGETQLILTPKDFK